jgi:hypothetical protein
MCGFVRKTVNLHVELVSDVLGIWASKHPYRAGKASALS